MLSVKLVTANEYFFQGMDSKNYNWSYKDLLFGVKRTSTKPSLIKLEQDPNNVRLRVLPTETPLKKRKILAEKVDNEGRMNI